MSQLLENLKFLSEESDEDFIKRSLVIIPVLKEELQKYAYSVLDELKKTKNNIDKPILYIPVEHTSNVHLSKEKEHKKDISDILSLKYSPDDFIAIGETLEGIYSIESRTRQLKQTMKMLNKLEVVPNEYLSSFEKVQSLFPFEEAISDFTQNKDIKVYGVESLNGAILSTALDMNANLLKTDYDGSFRNELKFRLGIEGRTRIAINKAQSCSGAASKVIFFQGALHMEGVKGWCKRNSARLQIIIPKSIKKDLYKI